ncbi:MAG: glycyl-radical enzyme activating protein [Saprospiraceae bacterium]|nr:glycyl-radical enzyme activating protein [Saprospiraceae bacterium]
MDAIIFDIKHFAVHDGSGIRQTVFFKGCPLDCWWCHNPESKNAKAEKYIKTTKLEGKIFERESWIGYNISVEELFEIISGDKVFFEESGGGVTFSGGEPLMQADFLFKILKKCKDSGIHTAIDTSGFASQEIIEKISKVAGLFLFDLKIIDSKLHEKYTGVSNERILENLKWLDENNKSVILRFPVIPGITDTKENIKEIKDFIKSLKNINQIDLLPYHNISNSKYKRFDKKNRLENIKSLSEKDMDSIKEEFENLGFTVGIGG